MKKCYICGKKLSFYRKGKYYKCSNPKCKLFGVPIARWRE